MNVIVVGYNHHNGLGLIRSLGEAGHNVHLLLLRSGFNYLNKSSFIQSCKILNSIKDLIPAVKAIANECDKKPVLFCCGDEEATYVNDNFETLNQYCYTEGAYVDGDVNMFHDKFKSNLLAQSHGFIIPRTWVVHNNLDIPNDLVFPLLVKAGDSIRGGKGVLNKYDDKESLMSALSLLPNHVFPLQVQEYLKKEYELIILGCSIDHGNQVFCPVAEKKIRYYPQEYRITAYTEGILIKGNKALEEVVDRITSMIKSIGYSGLFSVELIFANNQLYFLETNFRNDGTGYLATASGFNLPDVFCNSFFGHEMKLNFDKYRKCHYVNVIADGMNVVHQRVPFFSWIRQLKNANCYSHYSKKDKIPLFYAIVALFVNKLKRM